MLFVNTDDRPQDKRWMRRAAVALLVAGIFAAPAQASEQTLDRLMNASSADAASNISPVREAALKAGAMTLGTQTGLVERTREIEAMLKAKSLEMEKAFRFGDFVMGAGVLPPVITQTHNAQTVKENTMRLASSVYRIDAPARFFSGAPGWRDWLYMGLPLDEPEPKAPTEKQLLPQNAAERTFWKKTVREAYLSGREQAQQIFEDNLAHLEATYLGMRTYYDLYQRHMVSAPVIAKSQELVTHDDPNTIIVGDTLFRITVPSSFKTDVKDWVALAATPLTDTPLPVVQGYDPAQVKHAYEAHKATLAERNAQKTNVTKVKGGAAGVTGAATSTTAAKTSLAAVGAGIDPTPASTLPVQNFRVTATGVVPATGASFASPSFPSRTAHPSQRSSMLPAAAPLATAPAAATPLFKTGIQ